MTRSHTGFAKTRSVNRMAPLALLLLSMLVVQGCTLLPGAQPQAPLSTFAFDLPGFGTTAAPVPGSAYLQIAPLAWSAELGANAILYVSREYELGAYANAEWAAEPGRLIEPWVVAAFEASPAFAGVTFGPAPRGADYRLDLTLVALRHEFTVQPSRVRLVLRAELSNLRDGTMLAARRIVAIQAAPSEDAYGGVQAANAALAQALAELVKFSAETTAARS